MTEKITLELTLEELKQIDKYIEYHDYDCDRPLLDKVRSAYPVCRSCIEEAYKNAYGEYPSGTPSEDARWDAFLRGYQATQPKAVPVEEPTKPRSPLDEIVDRMVKEHQAKKLHNMLKVQLDFDGMVVDDILEIVEDWLPKEQNADGSQNVDTELLVDGFNHCLEQIKGMLR